MAWRCGCFLCFSVFVLLLASSSAEDGPLVNGDFETSPAGGFSSSDGQAAIPGWKTNGTVEVVESGEKQGGMILIVPQGERAVRLGNDAEIRQDMTVEKGATYSVTFSAARTCAQLESLNVSVPPASQTIDLQTLYSVQGWDSYAWAFTAAAGDSTVVFRNPGMEDDPSCGPIIDDIAIKKLFVPDRPKIFYQKTWQTIGKDVEDWIMSNLTKGEIPEEANETLLCLIPKVAQPSTPADYRPISLCNVLYKIMSKMIAGRLRPLLGSIISENQGAFLPGRQITDNILISFELHHHLKTRSWSSNHLASLKVDLSKVYDKVEWKYIELFMQKIGMAPSFVKLIMSCVTSVRYRVLLNGNAAGAIFPERGLRQGDPLSPYLFLFAAEGIPLALKKQATAGCLKGIRISPRAPMISHLIFADDIILFCKATVQEFHALKVVLKTFEMVSGQQINFSKSGLVFSRNTPSHVKAEITFLMGMQACEFHEKYLGLPTTNSRRSTTLFKPLIDKAWKQTENWNSKLLSIGGKEVLIKSTLQAVPTYSMQLFKLPKTITSQLEAIMNAFWWNDRGNKRFHWMSWKRICYSKERGGLGFREMEIFNDALLAKQAWRLIQYPDSLASKLLQAKHYPSSSFLDSELGSNPSIIWRSIWGTKDLIKAGLRWQIGGGHSISVWNDNWIAKDFHLRPQTSPSQLLQDLKVADLRLQHTGDWNIPLIESLFDPETVEAIIKTPLGSWDQPDKMIWHYSKNGLFTVKSAYYLKQHTSIQPEVQVLESEIWKKLWQIKIPAKIQIFTWKCIRGYLAIIDNFRNRHINISGNCYLCKTETETTVHTFFGCSYVDQVWQLLGIRNLFPPQVESVQAIFDHFLRTHSTKVIEILMTGCWLIWRARNQIKALEANPSPTDTYHRVSSFLSNLNLVSTQTPVTMSTHNHAGVWTRPPHGTFKINFDAAIFNEDNRIGIGIIIRNSEGEATHWQAISLHSTITLSS